MLRTLFLSLLVLAICTPIHAASPQADVSAWPTSKRSIPRLVVIASVADTKSRVKCRVKAITVDALTCRNQDGPDTIFERSDIAAIIAPERQRWNGSVALWTLSAASLAGSFFVPIVPSVVLRILTWVFLYGGAFGDNPTEAHLVYWRTGTAINLP